MQRCYRTAMASFHVRRRWTILNVFGRRSTWIHTVGLHSPEPRTQKASSQAILLSIMAEGKWFGNLGIIYNSKKLQLSTACFLSTISFTLAANFPKSAKKKQAAWNFTTAKLPSLPNKHVLFRCGWQHAVVHTVCSLFKRGDS